MVPWCNALSSSTLLLKRQSATRSVSNEGKLTLRQIETKVKKKPFYYQENNTYSILSKLDAYYLIYLAITS